MWVKAFQELKAKLVTQPISFAPDFAHGIHPANGREWRLRGCFYRKRIEKGRTPHRFPKQKFSKAERELQLRWKVELAAR
ncbi:hypothetical protein TNCV_2694101 [Trichonephila clavipes]|nr:hypothetical protein TNCV_2694101 [Trichonephila clavipes]